MAKKPVKTRADRITEEKERLEKIYSDIDDKKQGTVQGLIQRAAYMRVSLEDMEADIDLNGFTEKFSQGMQEPYDRKRPIADLYNTMNASYQKAINQLTGLLPKEEQKPESDDGFTGFVAGREDT
ncbi:MAG: hypothetical protein E7L17_13070 [Clostridium sp.]|uniref:hypothetical protein n=1 Tax=Clostridium sp. TaxID=1506 RepID=UPI0029065C91|nr:hypothetical protein [Clostridium sp.]MDU7339033.1 hypothetical protein [Clostridium sp.]